MEAYISSTVSDFDILIPSFFRPEVLDAALQKVASLKPDNLRKILVLTHVNDERTSKLLESYGHDLEIIGVLTKEVPTPGASRNILLNKAQANWICFLDDDVEVSDNYFIVAEQIIQNEQLNVFGGPDQPNPKNSFQKTLGVILSYPLLMGPTFRRHSRNTSINRNASELDLTLCNLWVKSSILKSDGLKFDEALRRCEENLLLDHIRAKGHRMGYFPQLFVYHLRRSKLQDIAEIQLRSGFYRGVELSLTGAEFKKVFLIPFLTGFAVIFLPLLSPETFSSLVLLHCALNLVLSLKSFFLVREPIAFVYSLILIAVIHLMFSLGLFIGSVKGRFSGS